MVDNSSSEGPKVGVRTGRVIAIALTGTAIAILACYLIDFYQVSPSQPEMKNLPPLIPAPSAAAQATIIAAIRAHPNPPFSVDLLPPPGSDAAGLAPLFAGLNKSTKEDITVYAHSLSFDATRMESTYLLIEVAGYPARVIRRRVETEYDP